MSDNGYLATVVRLGIPDKFIEHGSQVQLKKDCGYDTENIFKTIKSLSKKPEYTKTK